MKIIKVKKIPRKEVTAYDILITFCLFYPAYKLQEAEKLPYKIILKMIKLAQKKQAEHYYNLALISGNTMSKGIKKLLNHYKGIMNG